MGQNDIVKLQAAALVTSVLREHRARVLEGEAEETVEFSVDKDGVEAALDTLLGADNWGWKGDYISVPIKLFSKVEAALADAGFNVELAVNPEELSTVPGRFSNPDNNAGLEDWGITV